MLSFFDTLQCPNRSGCQEISIQACAYMIFFFPSWFLCVCVYMISIGTVSFVRNLPADPGIIRAGRTAFFCLMDQGLVRGVGCDLSTTLCCCSSVNSFFSLCCVLDSLDFPFSHSTDMGEC